MVKEGPFTTARGSNPQIANPNHHDLKIVKWRPQKRPALRKKKLPLKCCVNCQVLCDQRERGFVRAPFQHLLYARQKTIARLRRQEASRLVHAQLRRRHLGSRVRVAGRLASLGVAKTIELIDRPEANQVISSREGFLPRAGCHLWTQMFEQLNCNVLRQSGLAFALCASPHSPKFPNFTLFGGARPLFSVLTLPPAFLKIRAMCAWTRQAAGRSLSGLAQVQQPLFVPMALADGHSKLLKVSFVVRLLPENHPSPVVVVVFVFVFF